MTGRFMVAFEVAWFSKDSEGHKSVSCLFSLAPTHVRHCLAPDSIRFVTRGILIMVTRINLIVGSFAVIAVITLLQCVEGNIILAGEDTPVWTVRCNNPPCDHKNNPPSYKRLNKDTIKRAYDYWKSDRFVHLSSHVRRIQRDISEKEEEMYEMIARENPNAELLELPAGNGSRSSRSILNERQFGTVEASVLVVMNYDASHVTDDESRRKFVKENVLYALAYWNNFNKRVWEIKGIRDRPHVQVKLVGIVIGLDREATPYVKSDFYAQDCLRKANTFWRNPPSPKEFPRNSYHAVATMTDVKPYGSYGAFEVVVDSDNGNSPSIIVWDKPNFWILKLRAKIYYQQVGNYLRQWADKYPKVYDHMKPGNRVEEILPGMLIRPEDQCNAAGYHDLDRICSEQSTECRVICKNKGFLRFCGDIGVALAGTPCVNGKVG